MLLLETMEMVGGVWLAMSVIAFILVAAFIKTREKSVVIAVESTVTRESLIDLRQPSPRTRQLDRLDRAKKRPGSDEALAPLVKAA